VSPWSPTDYLKFGDERTQPSRDLVARIDVESPLQVADLGCGPGNSTRVVHERWPAARLLGVDSSEDMLAHARQSGVPAQWQLADVAGWEPAESFDVVYTSATLQWIPDHAALLPRLFKHVSEGGAFAVQLPANDNSPLHQAVLAVSQRARWRARTEGCSDLLTYRRPDFYYRVLAPICARLALWETTYWHVLPDHQGLIEWYATTGLRPYLERLAGADERRAFQAEILEACAPEYPVQPDHQVLYPFRRLFFVAYK